MVGEDVSEVLLRTYGTVEVSTGGHLVSTLTQSRVRWSTQGHLQLVWSISKAGDSAASVGNLLQCLTVRLE